MKGRFSVQINTGSLLNFPPAREEVKMELLKLIMIPDCSQGTAFLIIGAEVFFFFQYLPMWD